MDATRWQHVEQLFHRALELRAEARDAYLHAACGDDRALRAEVESLLAQAPHSDQFLNVPALELAAATTSPVDPLRLDAAPLDAVPPDGSASALRTVRVGDQVDHYRVLRKLGEGGMGVVFEAEDERLGRRVALKVLRHDGADPHARERLIREARVAAGVVHPLICQVYALGTLGRRAPRRRRPRLRAL